MKSLQQIKKRLKHLRGQHNQLDHAWNRGMGSGSQISVSDYRNIIKRLDEQVAAGEITQQMADLTRDNVRKKANAYYDTMSSVSRGMNSNRVQRAIERLSTIRGNSGRISNTTVNGNSLAQDISSAAQQNQLANNANYLAAKDTIEPLMSDFPKQTKDQTSEGRFGIRSFVPVESFQKAYDLAMSMVANDMSRFDAGVKRLSKASLAKLQYNAFRAILNEYRPTNDPRSERYNIIPPQYQSMDPLVYKHVVDALLHGMIAAQLQMEKPQAIKKAQPISPDSSRPYKIMSADKPKIENKDVASEINLAFDTVKMFKPYIEYDIEEKSNAIASIVQSLSEENQMHLVENYDAQMQLKDKKLLAEVTLAIAAFGHPNARMRLAELAYKHTDKSLYDTISKVNLEAALAAGKTDEELKTAITELIRYGAEDLTGAHLQQAFSQVGPNKDIPESQRRHFFANGIVPPEPHPRIVKLMNDMYEETQKRLQESGITEVRLFRGGPLQGGLPYEPWSTSQSTAESFAHVDGLTQSDVRTTIIPAKYIFSNYVYSNFFADEYEFPILAQSFYANPKTDVEITQIINGYVSSDQIKIENSPAIMDYLSNIGYNQEVLKDTFQYRSAIDPAIKMGDEPTLSSIKYLKNILKYMTIEELNNKKYGKYTSRSQMIEEKIAELKKEKGSKDATERSYAISYLYALSGKKEPLEDATPTYTDLEITPADENWLEMKNRLVSNGAKKFIKDAIEQANEQAKHYLENSPDADHAYVKNLVLKDVISIYTDMKNETSRLSVLYDLDTTIMLLSRLISKL